MPADRTLNPWNSSLPSPDLVPQYKGEWAAAAYQKADLVTLNGNMYIALVNTNTTQIPGSNPSQWKLMLPGNTNAEEFDEIRTVAEQADSKADNVSATVTDVQARVDAAPISAPAQTRGTIYRGGVPYYPAPAGLTPDGVTVIEEPSGLYYRSTDTVLPWEYGALPGTATTQRNSGAALYNWAADAPRGSILTLPAGVWYTDRTLDVTTSNVKLDWRGYLRPFGSFAGFLAHVSGAVVDDYDIWGPVSDDNIWQPYTSVPRITVDGMGQSRGVLLSNLDHSDIEVYAGRTKGTALQINHCRETDIRLIARQCEADGVGEDHTDPAVAVVRFSDIGLGDPTNGINCINWQMVFNWGRQISIDSPQWNPADPLPGYPSPVRFIDFISPHVEVRREAAKWGGVTRTPYTGHKIYLGWARSVTMTHPTFSPGLIDANGSMVRVGDGSKYAENFQMFGGRIFGDVPAGASVVDLHNCSYDVQTGFELVGGGANTPIKYGPAATPIARRGRLRRAMPGATPGIILENDGSANGNLSPFMELYTEVSANPGGGAARSAIYSQLDSRGLPDVVLNSNPNYGGTDTRITPEGVSLEALRLTARATAPTPPVQGYVYLADRTNWNPLNRDAATPAYLVRWDGTAWVAVA